MAQFCVWRLETGGDNGKSAVNIVKLETGKNYPQKSSEELMMALRLHDQMLSCLNFVIEKAQHYHHEDPDEDPGLLSLFSSIDYITNQRQKIYAELGATRNSANAFEK